MSHCKVSLDVHLGATGKWYYVRVVVAVGVTFVMVLLVGEKRWMSCLMEGHGMKVGLDKDCSFFT